MKKFTTDMTDAPVPAFAAPHKIWCCSAEEATALLQFCHAEKFAGAREAGKREEGAVDETE
jgi:hypothetical protein